MIHPNKRLAYIVRKFCMSVSNAMNNFDLYVYYYYTDTLLYHSCNKKLLLR